MLLRRASIRGRMPKSMYKTEKMTVTVEVMPACRMRFLFFCVGRRKTMSPSPMDPMLNGIIR